MNRYAMRENEMKPFAKPYAIPLRRARAVCDAGGSGPKAVDLLVGRMKQIAPQPEKGN